MKPLSDWEVELDHAENCRNAAKQTYRENVVALAILGMVAIVFLVSCVGCVR